MKKYQKINFIVFLSVVIVTTIPVYIKEFKSQPDFEGKPWHLQPTVHEDSLSDIYKLRYKILGKQRLCKQFKGKEKQVVILVDAWGVPNEENLLAEDFSFFADEPSIYAVHQRLANRTKHAEMTEFRNDVSENIYLFGGDSLEYGRPKYISELGFMETFFCQGCNDSIMIETLDSIMNQDSAKFIAWTTQTSRSGDRDSLHHSLQLIARFARRFPDTEFIIQGTHRPTLGAPEIRKSYKAHWVPAVILNAHE